jgi:hypothetical protein
MREAFQDLGSNPSTSIFYNKRLNNNVGSLTVSLTGSCLYQRFHEERNRILENKWYMSEREGRDVGFERALLDWVFNHRDKWIKGK